MSPFDDALGHGPTGPTYRPPTARPRTLRERVKAWAWYRWGVGHRPQPRYQAPDDKGGRRRR